MPETRRRVCVVTFTILKDPKAEWERPALTTHGRNNHALRTSRWRYIRYADGSEELYDLAVDPGEEDNLVSKRPDVLASMRRAAAELLR